VKPRGPISQLRAFQNVFDKYTGRRLFTKPLRPILPRIPSPAAALLRALGL